MDWKDWPIAPATHALISPLFAKNFRVIPLGEDGEVVKLLSGENLPNDARVLREKQLEFFLGRPVVLVGLDAFPELENSFDEVLDCYYGITFPMSVSRPAGSMAATVLLLDPDSVRQRINRELLTQKGFVVVDAATVEEAIEVLRSPCCNLNEVLLPGQSWPEQGEAIRRIRVLADVVVRDVSEALAEQNNPIDVPEVPVGSY